MWCLLMRVVSGTVHNNGAAGRLERHCTRTCKPRVLLTFSSQYPEPDCMQVGRFSAGSRRDARRGGRRREKGGARKKAGAAGAQRVGAVSRAL